MNRSLFALAMLVGVTMCALADCCTANTISVNGNGKATGTPDMVTFSAGVTELRKTSREAAAAAAAKTNQILAVLASNNVRQIDIQTSQLFINPRYSYPNGTQVLEGQEASQTVSVKLRNINPDGAGIGKIVDALVAINGIQVSGLSFDIENKTALQREARKNAFIDANVKAAQLAFLSGKNLGTVLTITEGTSSNFIPRQPLFAMAMAGASTSTSISVGSLDISVDVTIVWNIK